MSDRQLDPKQAASCFIHIHRCLGRWAVGNDPNCHPEADPGSYHVGLGPFVINEGLLTFGQAKECAESLQAGLALVLRYDREGDDKIRSSAGPVRDFGQALEVDFFGGRDAYRALEVHLESQGAKRKRDYSHISDTTQVPEGWLLAVHIKPPRKEVSCDIFLVIPVSGVIHFLGHHASPPGCKNLDYVVEHLKRSALASWLQDHPETPKVYLLGDQGMSQEESKCLACGGSPASTNNGSTLPLCEDCSSKRGSPRGVTPKSPPKEPA